MILGIPIESVTVANRCLQLKATDSKSDYLLSTDSQSPYNILCLALSCSRLSMPLFYPKLLAFCTKNSSRLCERLTDNKTQGDGLNGLILVEINGTSINLWCSKWSVFRVWYHEPMLIQAGAH